MELDSYGIYTYFTGNVNNISVDTIQTVDIYSTHVRTSQGTFQLEKKLGEGSYGKTYSTAPVQGVSYAIKIMDIRNMQELYNVLSEVIMNIILMEGTQMEPKGPYVPFLYEFGITADQRTAIIRHERLTDTMFHYVQTKSPQVNNTLIPQIILSILHMLDLLQTKYQFNHRDLKSDNVMYTLKHGKPVWRLIDLGGACLTWNGFSISSQSIFDKSRPCMHPGRDMTFLLTELALDAPITPQLQKVLHNMVTFPMYGQVCALNSEYCPHVKYTTWEHLYNVLNKTNIINPKSAHIKQEMTQFLQKLKRSFWNWTRRKAKHGRLHTRRNRTHTSSLL